MTSKEDKKIFENAVKPFFHPVKQCYIAYSTNEKLSSEAKFESLTPKQVKAKFGFELLCDDLSKSVEGAEDFHSKHKITTLVPKTLEETLKKTSYGIETNTLNLFVLHKISSKIGYGISTYSALKKGVIVAEYVGERKHSGIKIDDSTYLLLNDDGTNIDAKDYGNVARFFNHCPSDHTDEQVMTANLMILPWKVSETLTKVFFMTLRDIKEFEPLCFDYGDKFGFDQNVELLNAETYLPTTEFKYEL